MYSINKMMFTQSLAVQGVFAILFSIFFTACKDDNTEQAVPYKGLNYTAGGSLTLKLNHTFDGVPLQFNKDYITAAQDSIRINMLRYYLTNVQLKNEHGVWVNLGNYNLVDFEDQASLNIQLGNVPKGIYSNLRFYVGVDSIANSSGAQEGALNPANNMFWSWATGYIFFKIQGTYSADEPMTLHIGGNVNMPVVELDLTAFKQEGNRVTMNVSFDAADIYRTPVIYDLKTMSAVIHSATNKDVGLLRDNIQTGVFSITSLE